MEQFKNLPTTTLNGGIDGSVTSLTVTSAALFPTSGTFRILIDSEILEVTAVAGTTFTVTRGTEGSSAAAHSNGATISGILTEDAIQQFRQDNSESGTHSALSPAAIKNGRILWPTDAPYLIRDDGSSVYYSGQLWKMVPPVNGDFAWVNQDSATVATTNGGVYIESVSGSSSTDLHIRKKTAPATPYSVTAFLRVQWHHQDFLSAGICFRESATSKISTLQQIRSTSGKLEVTYLTNETTFSSAPVSVNLNAGVAAESNWLRLEHDGTNLKYLWSCDGYNFYQIHTHAKTTHFTSGPDEIGFFVNTANASGSYKVGAHLLSWREG